ncbi:MAG: hypothetical protein ACLQU5_35845 [Isosphaeraceae bacterium]
MRAPPTAARWVFKELSLEQLSELLKVTQEYRQTGQLPEWMLGKKPRAPKAGKAAPKPPKMTPADAVARLEDLQHRALNLEPDEITREVHALEAMTANELKTVLRVFLGAVTGRKKGDYIHKLEEQILSYRQSLINAKEILES